MDGVRRCSRLGWELVLRAGCYLGAGPCGGLLPWCARPAGGDLAGQQCSEMIAHTQESRPAGGTFACGVKCPEFWSWCCL